MKNILKTVSDIVFSFGAFVGLLIFGLIYIITSADAERRQTNQICYAQNMVRVNTDAGERCASPSSLVVPQ